MFVVHTAIRHEQGNLDVVETYVSSTSQCGAQNVEDQLGLAEGRHETGAVRSMRIRISWRASDCDRVEMLD